MKLNITIDNQIYATDLTLGKSIAITMLPNGNQPNHFDAPECRSQTLISGDFIGDTTKGGSCNVNQLSIIPHCNGTHTESVSHIINELVPVHQSVERSLFPCVLISIEPTHASQVQDDYQPSIDSENLVITKTQLVDSLKHYSNTQVEGLVIRSLPNSLDKKSQVYDSNHYPIYLTNDAMHYLVERNVKHLLVDFPSVDKMYDEGMLTNHRIFWNVEVGKKSLSKNTFVNKTISEMVFVADTILDGFYLCNLQVPEIETDAVPSRPELYPLQQS